MSSLTFSICILVPPSAGSNEVFAVIPSETGPPVRHAAPRLQQGDGGHAHGEEAARHLLQSGFLRSGEFPAGFSLKQVAT